MSKLSRNMRIPLSNSLIFRGAVFTFTMFFLSFSVYLYATFRVFSSSYNWIRSENVSQSSKLYMGSLKEIDRRERQHIAFELSQYLLTKQSGTDLNPIKSLSKKFNKDLMAKALATIDSKKIKFDDPNISQLNSAVSIAQFQKPVEWTSRSTLRVLNYSADITTNHYEAAYRKAEEKLRKLKLFENKMINDLVNGLFKITVSVSFICFAFMLYFYLKRGREFNGRIRSFFRGLKKWSRGDFTHREIIDHGDELSLIQEHFNELADEVEKGRKKSIDMEKISHWQTVAKKMAHEVKNPLTPIQLIFSGIKRSYKGDDPAFKTKLADSYSLILEEVSGLRRLVDAFTKFSSLPVSKPERADLCQTICSVIHKYKSGPHNHELLFENETGNNTFDWLHDPGLLAQVLSNLVKNAIEACGSSPSQIILTLSRQDDSALIEIKDNGPGIPKDIQQNVFDAHFSTKNIDGTNNISSDTGMGLGLSVCQKVVYDHGGDISFESVPYNTIFRINLPK